MGVDMAMIKLLLYQADPPLPQLYLASMLSTIPCTAVASNNLLKNNTMPHTIIITLDPRNSP